MLSFTAEEKRLLCQECSKLLKAHQPAIKPEVRHVLSGIIKRTLDEAIREFNEDILSSGEQLEPSAERSLFADYLRAYVELLCEPEDLQRIERVILDYKLEEARDPEAPSISALSP